MPGWWTPKAASEWQSQLVPRYRRSSAEVEQSVLGVYLSGSNTRRTRRALEPLLTVAALSTATRDWERRWTACKLCNRLRLTGSMATNELWKV